MKLIVCGGRDFTGRDVVFAALDMLDAQSRITCVVHGGATGADSFAAEWATARGREQRVYSPEWAARGNVAGPMRNTEMLRAEREGLQAVVGFDGGGGTRDMLRKAYRNDVPAIRVRGAVAPFTFEKFQEDDE